MFEIYNKHTGEVVDTDKEFNDHGVVIGLDGKIKLIYYGSIVSSVDETKYGIRLDDGTELS